MRLIGQDPDIQTLVNRIEKKEIDLQPDFQRGEVWGLQKKRKLIDTILRDWHIPPIHIVVVEDTGQQEVLDGQQRLASIRDFALGNLTVDGNTAPENEEIRKLDGLIYDQLPQKFKRRFNNFTIRVFRLTDYDPGEPGELFYRLNQPTNLTAAEQRNAFFGPTRNQIRNIVSRFKEFGIDKELLGFSNSRMAYDDIVAKVCYTIHQNTLKEKVTALSVTQMYRSNQSFSGATIETVTNALSLFGKMRSTICRNIKFNKATLFSWMCFLIVIYRQTAIELPTKLLGNFINKFEISRESFKKSSSPIQLEYYTFPNDNYDFMDDLLSLFNDRASARVNDVSSVITRDFIIWLFFYFYIGNTKDNYLIDKYRLNTINDALSELSTEYRNQTIPFEEMIMELTKEYDWGRL